MSKWEQLSLWLKQHYLCVIVWLVVVLIALIVVMAGNDKELVGYFGFACSLSGILLAIVVIIHTWIDSADTRTVLTEVKSHLTVIQGEVGKTASDVEQMMKVNEYFEKPKRYDVQKDVEQTEPPPLSVVLKTQFKLSDIRIQPLLYMYCSVKSYQHKKKIHIPDVVRKVFPEIKEEFVTEFASVALGILMMFEGLIGFHGLGSPLKTPMEITKCDIQIQQSVEEELNKRIEDPTNPSYSERIRCWKQAIDDYCTS